MSTVAEVLLQDAADALRRRVMSLSELSPSDRAFLAWALHEDTQRDDLVALATTAATDFSTARSYHNLATVGYAAHASGIDEVQAQVLRHGLKWLRGRSPDIAGEPAPFFTDAVALLGIALGLACSGVMMWSPRANGCSRSFLAPRSFRQSRHGSDAFIPQRFTRLGPVPLHFPGIAASRMLEPLSAPAQSPPAKQVERWLRLTSS